MLAFGNNPLYVGLCLRLCTKPPKGYKETTADEVLKCMLKKLKDGKTFQQAVKECATNTGCQEAVEWLVENSKVPEDCGSYSGDPKDSSDPLACCCIEYYEDFLKCACKLTKASAGAMAVCAMKAYKKLADCIAENVLS
jgi:hypothetical protein